MPSVGRRPVPYSRTATSTVLGLIGLFVISAGVGAGDWVTLAVGVAVLAAGIGWFAMSAMAGRYRLWVSGTAFVVSCSPMPVGVAQGRCVLRLLVHVEGAADVQVTVREPRVAVAKWPMPRETLPILVPVGEPRRARVRWEAHPGPAQSAAGRPAAPSWPPVPDVIEMQVTQPVPRRRPSPGPTARRAAAQRRATAGIPAARQPVEAAGGAAELVVEHVTALRPALPAMPDVGRPTAGQQDEVTAELIDAYLSATPRPDNPLAAQVQGVGVTLFVTDLERSAAFYRDLLGFRQVDRVLGSAVLEFGGGRVVLRRVADMPPVDRRLMHLLLEVVDITAAYQALRAKGVEFVHRPRAVGHYEQLDLWSAAFRDPDGHGMALTRWQPRR